MLKIVRDDLDIDKEELYEVLIDNHVIGTIANNEIQNWDIKNGHHMIMIKSKDYISKQINFDINSGEIFEFNCGPQYKNTFLSKMLYKFIFMNKGLYLRKKTDFYL